MTSKDAYEELADMLCSEGIRVGPGMNTPEFKEMLRLQYTPEEALLATQIGFEGGKLEELAERTRCDKEALKEKLEVMVHKGTMWVDPVGENPTYKILEVEAPGIIESVGWVLDPSPEQLELRKRWHNYFPTYYKEGVIKLGALLGPYAATKALPPDATPEENVIEVVKGLDYWAVSNCGCRVFAEAELGHPKCQHPVRTCMSFGDTGRWAVKYGFAEEITLDEAIKILLEVEDAGLMHYGYPPIGQFCNCCKDVCINLLGLQMGLPHTVGQNAFVSVCDEETCTACGICEDRCHVGAICIDDFAVIDASKCVGCGVCVVGCDQQALKLQRRSDASATDHLILPTESSSTWDVRQKILGQMGE